MTLIAEYELTVESVVWEIHSQAIYLETCFTNETFALNTLSAFGIDIEDESDLAIITKLAVCAYTLEHYSAATYSLYNINVFFYGYFEFYVNYFGIFG